MKVLLIDGDPALTKTVGSFLNIEGYRCEIFRSAEPAQAALHFIYYDVIVFTLTSLDDGELRLLKFLRDSKMDKRTVLTYEPNKIVNSSKVEALAMANLRKPYVEHELFERVSSVQNTEGFESGRIFFWGELKIDLPARMVYVRNRAVGLTRSEFDLLYYLVLNRSQVLSKNKLARYLSKDSSADSSDFGSLYAHMKNLKRKLKMGGCTDFITTIYGIGYRFGK